jgi:uncharacterized membrane protein YiaA
VDITRDKEEGWSYQNSYIKKIKYATMVLIVLLCRGIFNTENWKKHHS